MSTTTQPYPSYNGSVAESNLFKPINVGPLQLNHRLALAPLTRFRHVNHINSDLQPEYYAQRAQYPGTLLISEATMIDPKAGGYALSPGAWSPEQFARWKRVYERVHAQGSYMFTQLVAIGRSGESENYINEGIEVVSASDVPVVGGPTPRALTTLEIKEYVSWFVRAARASIDAGADGIEIHAANGYLLDQFLHAGTNKRTDAYGGSVVNRSRFLLEVVNALGDAIGFERVAVRLSPWNEFGEMDVGDYTVAQFSYVAEQLEKLGQAGKHIAYLHVIEPRVAGNDDVEPATEDLNMFFYRAWSGPVIRAGGLIPVAHDVANMDDRTIIAAGRYFISNPDLVQRLKDKTPLVRYDRSTFYWDGSVDQAVGYTDYPKEGQPTRNF